jgi:hypothetical protein
MDLTALLSALATAAAVVAAYELPKLARKTKNTVDDAVVDKALEFIEDADLRARAVAAVVRFFSK